MWGGVDWSPARGGRRRENARPSGNDEPALPLHHLPGCPDFGPWSRRGANNEVVVAATTGRRNDPITKLDYSNNVIIRLVAPTFNASHMGTPNDLPF